MIPHKGLIRKLKFYGIRGNTLLWIQQWIIGRTQRVVVDGDNSMKAPVQSGVMQGTVLGPLMFQMCINDIGETSSDIRLFADDYLLYRVIRGDTDARELQKYFFQLWSWAKTGKCYSMLANAYFSGSARRRPRSRPIAPSMARPWRRLTTICTLELNYIKTLVSTSTSPRLFLKHRRHLVYYGGTSTAAQKIPQDSHIKH